MRVSLSTLKVGEAIDIARYALTVFAKTEVDNDGFHIFLEDIEREQ